MVPQPGRGRAGRLQRPPRLPAQRIPRHRCPDRGDPRCGRPARESAHRVPRGGRRSPAGRPRRPRRAAAGADRPGHRGPARRPDGRAHAREVRPDRGAAAAGGSVRAHADGVGALDRDPPHRRGRAVGRAAPARPGDRLYRSPRRGRAAVDTAAGAVRRLCPVAARGAGPGRRPGQPAVRTARVLAAGAGGSPGTAEPPGGAAGARRWPATAATWSARGCRPRCTPIW